MKHVMYRIFNVVTYVPIYHILGRRKYTTQYMRAFYSIGKGIFFRNDVAPSVTMHQIRRNSFSSNTNENAPIIEQLKKVLLLRTSNISSWIIESHVKALCGSYKCLEECDRREFLGALAEHFSVDHEAVCTLVRTLVVKNQCNDLIVKNAEKLRNILTPQYHWLFVHIGRLENGVKFLVDLRTDILGILRRMDSTDAAIIKMQQLDINLRQLIFIWFSVGFLNLQRITWNSSCEMLQKISEYEAVHPVRSWTDLKRRVGPYRRCFVYTHNSMPGEPLVVLHTALTNEISSNVAAITLNPRRGSKHTPDDVIDKPMVDLTEDYDKIRAAIFYSISSTQKGLEGIELGNYLIKRVARELLSEFPCIDKFSSLSPIPNFKKWLFEKLKPAKNSLGEVFSLEEVTQLEEVLQNKNIADELKRVLKNNGWLEMPKLVSCLEQPMMRLCAKYLYGEKRRGYALNGVANFHLRNGAVMWRLNWLADVSPRGLENSLGMMVNYRYYLNETENHSRNYIENFVITASPLVQKLVDSK